MAEIFPRRTPPSGRPLNERRRAHVVGSTEIQTHATPFIRSPLWSNCSFFRTEIGILVKRVLEMDTGPITSPRPGREVNPYLNNRILNAPIFLNKTGAVRVPLYITVTRYHKKKKKWKLYLLNCIAFMREMLAKMLLWFEKDHRVDIHNNFLHLYVKS